MTPTPLKQLWEEFDVKLHRNEKVYVDDDGSTTPYPVKCPHRRYAGEERWGHSDQVVRTKYIYDAVVIGTNEGGYNTVGVCAYCLRDFLNKELR